MKKLSNITVKEFREILQRLGLRPLRTVGGHEIWMKSGLRRTIVFQTMQGTREKIKNVFEI